MKCPACTHTLKKFEAGSVVVDVCEAGCGGIWFDQFEFKKFDEPHEGEGILLLKIPNGKTALTSDSRNCPKCVDIKMLKRFSSAKRKIEIDECGKCAGIWIDAGELAAIRNEFKTESERNSAAEALFSEIFSRQLADESSKSQEELKRIRRVSNAFKFICPSYYVPGKQTGGAF